MPWICNYLYDTSNHFLIDFCKSREVYSHGTNHPIMSYVEEVGS